MSPRIRSLFKLFRATDGPPVGRRLSAYAIDWALGGVASGFPAVFLYGALTKRTDLFSDLYVFEALGLSWISGIAAGLFCIASALWYFVYVPWRIWPGQTLGKRLMHLRVVDTCAESPTASTLLIREALVGFLLESSGFVIGRYIQQLVTLIIRIDVQGIWQNAGLIITIASFAALMCTRRQLALHDIVSRTHVIDSLTQR